MENIIVDISWGKNYTAVLDEVGGIVVATHKTLEGVKDAFYSALEFHIEGLKKDKDDIPKVLQGEYELEFKMDVHALLNHFGSVLNRSALSKRTGINAKLLGHYAQGRRNPKEKQREKIILGIQQIGKEFISVV